MFLAKAADWAAQHKTRLTVLSTDWSLEQLRRERAKVAAGVDVLFAGPGGLEAAEPWRLGPAARCVLVSPERRVVKSPRAMELP